MTRRRQTYIDRRALELAQVRSWTKQTLAQVNDDLIRLPDSGLRDAEAQTHKLLRRRRALVNALAILEEELELARDGSSPPTSDPGGASKTTPSRLR